MAVPKRRRSKSKKRMRAANWKAYVPTLTKCSNSNCNDLIKPHRACYSCGYYKGKQIIQVKYRETKKDKEPA